MPTHIRGAKRDDKFNSLAQEKTREAALETLRQLKAQLTNGTGVKGGRLRINAKGETFKRARWWQLCKRSDDANHRKTYDTLVRLLKNAGLDETKHTETGVLKEFQSYFEGPHGKKHVGTKQALKTINAALELVHVDSSKENQQDVLKTLGEKGDCVGKGSYGEVFKFRLKSSSLSEDNRDCVLKTFSYKSPDAGWTAPTDLVFQPSATENSTRFAKGGSSSLVNINHGELLSSKLAKSPITGVTYNQHFVIEERNSVSEHKFHSVSARALKLFIRTRPLNSMICLRNTIQREAKGEDISQLSSPRVRDACTPKQRTEIQHQILKSGLDTLVNMAEKGYVHRDIKPDNMKFDPISRAVTFLDPGGLFKFTNQEGGELQEDVARFGTKGYRHPAADDEAKVAQVGVKSDVYAFAMTVLRAITPNGKELRDFRERKWTSDERLNKLDTLMDTHTDASPEIKQAIRSLCELALDSSGGRTKDERKNVAEKLGNIRSDLMKSESYKEMANQLRAQSMTDALNRRIHGLK